MEEKKEILTYTMVFHSARKKLNITINEYCVADTIYHLSNNPRNKLSGWCYAPKKKIADYLNVDKRTIYKIINSLLGKKILEKHKETRYLRTTNKWYKNVILMKLEIRGTDQKADIVIKRQRGGDQKADIVIKRQRGGDQKAEGGDQKADNIYIYKDINKDKKEFENIFSLYKQRIHNGSILTNNAKVKIRARLNTFTEDQLIQAMDNFSKAKWWMENNAHRGIAWFFHSDDRIDQFINLKAENTTNNNKFQEIYG